MFRLSIHYGTGGNRRVEVFDALSVQTGHARYLCSVINGEPKHATETGGSERPSLLVRLEDHPDRPPRRLWPGRNKQRIQIRGGQDGSCELDSGYYTGYRRGRPFYPRGLPTRRKMLGKWERRAWGLARMEEIEEISLVAVPDLAGPMVSGSGETDDDALALGHGELLRHCRRSGDRFALLDSLATRGRDGGQSAVRQLAGRFAVLDEAADGALYFPWILATHPTQPAREVLVPPSGHVAGVYARLAGSYGLLRTPANASLHGARDLETEPDARHQMALYTLGVNCLRALPGRGIRVWGARTLSPTDRWRYIQVRLTYLALVRFIRSRLRWTVFEPNTDDLCERIHASLTLLCRELHGAGALAGAHPEDAFYVRCDASTNPPERQNSGHIVAHLGFAPTRPAEFIHIVVTREPGDLIIKSP